MKRRTTRFDWLTGTCHYQAEMLRLEACASRPEAGTKAMVLGRLLQAGFAVPAGWVLLDGERIDTQRSADELERLGGEFFAVRSSASIEDDRGAAAGVFRSFVRVARAEVAPTIAQVRASLDDSGVRAYLGWRKLPRATVKLAVLVHRFVDVEMLGVAIPDGDGFLVDLRPAAEPEWGQVTTTRLRRQSDDPKAALLGRLAALLGPVQVEFGVLGNELVVLQARPFVERPASTIAMLEGDWAWDRAHNPFPLSAAQQSLVAWVSDVPGPRQSVFQHYLYVEKGAAAEVPPLPAAQLGHQFAEVIAPACRAALGAVQATDLPSVLDAYRTVYLDLTGRVAPALRQVRASFDQLLRDRVGEGIETESDLLGGVWNVTLERDELLYQLGRAPVAARSQLLTAYHQSFGAYAPAWDVRVACDEEASERVLAEAAAWARSVTSPRQRHAEAEVRAKFAIHRLTEALPSATRRDFTDRIASLRALLPIAEADDQLFFMAQAAVRRALLLQGKRLCAEGRLQCSEDIFELPIASCREASSDLQAAARAGRTARLAAGAVRPPRGFHAGSPLFDHPPRGAWRGHPTAGIVSGTARVVGDGGESCLPGEILVVPSLLPSLSAQLSSAQGLVTEVGGATSHGATLAREYGIPAVLGIGVHSIRTGDRLFVDGERGRVYLAAAEGEGGAEGISRGSLDRL